MISLLVAATLALTPLQIDGVITDIAAKQQHRVGGEDDELATRMGMARIDQIAKTRPVHIQCGNVTNWAIWKLKRLGVVARWVGGHSVDDNRGHVMLEVLHGSRFVVYDIDRNVQPLEHGKAISGTRLFEMVRAGESIDFRWLADDPAPMTEDQIHEFYADRLRLMRIGA